MRLRAGALQGTDAERREGYATHGPRTQPTLLPRLGGISARTAEVPDAAPPLRAEQPAGAALGAAQGRRGRERGKGREA